MAATFEAGYILVAPTEAGGLPGLPATRGCYGLLLRIRAAQTIAVGALGRCAFPLGWYVYCGSAQGRGGLRARVRRHLNQVQSAKCKVQSEEAGGFHLGCGGGFGVESTHGPGVVRHWHVDYLRAVAPVAAVWLWPHAPREYECLAATAFASLPGASRSVPGFGSSDCRCPGHLVALGDRLELPFAPKSR